MSTTSDAQWYAYLAEKLGIADEEPNYGVIAAIRGEDAAKQFRRECAALRAARVHVDDRPCVMHPEDDCSADLPCASCPLLGRSGGRA